MLSISKIGRTLLAGVAAVSIASSAMAAEMTLKLGHLANEQNVWHKAALKFGEELKTLTNGRIEVEVYPNESLGKEMDLLTGMQLGTVDMTISGESLQNWAPMAALLAVPYAYKSLEQMDAVAGGEIGDQIEAEIIAKAQVRPIAYFARGPRNLTSNRAIKSPDDLNGLKLRVPNVPLFVDVWKALGAQPTPMAFSEVFTSLQNGTIDAQENPITTIWGAGGSPRSTSKIRSVTTRSGTNGSAADIRPLLTIATITRGLTPAACRDFTVSESIEKTR